MLSVKNETNQDSYVALVIKNTKCVSMDFVKSLSKTK
jgi:hypothetical protein